MTDEPPDPGASGQPGGAGDRDDPRRRELLALHAERTELELRLARAGQQRAYLADPAAAAAAEAEEAALLQELDRLMTRIRAAEYRSRPGARTW
ncbi:hypothetical protein EU555_31330 [Methylobacterium nonmethylotrophicum]|uniref:Uncharacterized protein n=1 Tax=Methylobacterium nonmethylotrophicum TaxID=1141884 RepID=A0A4Z0NFC3_9HYPH|nr:hypothetical protein EU555_31330 [Methylobacterium nonmethylotrophicum]